MKTKIYLFSLLVLLFFTFCNDNDNDDVPTNSLDIEINNDSSTLNKRLDYTDSGVISTSNSSDAKSKSSQSVTDLPLVQIAEVNAPIDKYGRTLQANHVAVNGNYVYVAYTMSGNIYSGAIDLIDITDPYKPKVLSSALIADTDITSLTYSNGHLIIAAARDIDVDPSLTSPAIILNMQLNSGLLTENYTINKLEGQVTTDVTSNSASYFATTGDAGSLFKINQSSQAITGKVTLEDLRTVAINGSKIVTLSGTKGINIFNESDFMLQKSFSTSTDVSGAKRTIDFDGTKVLVAEGYNGLGVYDINSGTKLQTIALVNAGGDNVTNAVSTNDGYAFIANGAAGLNTYQLESQLNLVGTIGISGSSNYVKSSGDYIYVASGKGGLKIIKMEKPAPIPPICTGLGPYSGGPDLILNSNEIKSYSGSTSLNSIIVNSGGVLTHCGSITVQNNITLNSGGTFNMNGTLAQGIYQQTNPTEIIINSNGLLQVEGTVVIWGDLRLNSGAKMHFVGNSSVITIYGKVTKASDVSITGNYTDTEGKLD